jgi:uncharacterized YigZ family protein
MDDVYKTIEKESTGYFKDKGSKFLSFAYPIRSEEDVKDIITNLKKEHHSARHHCYAWRLGTEEIRSRANDDGEPSSTAGKPILGQLQSFEVTNVLLVVVRYFGGTLLGASGLINAYKTAAKEALNSAEVVTKVMERTYELRFGYDLLNTVMNLLKQENLEIITTDFKESCRLEFSVRKSSAERVSQVFKVLYGVEIKSLC